MLSAALPSKTVETIATEAVADARNVHAFAPDFSRDFLIADEAAALAGRRLYLATLSAMGVDGLVTPFGYWERAARPAVAAVLGRQPLAGA